MSTKVFRDMCNICKAGFVIYGNMSFVFVIFMCFILVLEIYNIRNLEISRFLEIFPTVIRIQHFHLRLPSFVLFRLLVSYKVFLFNE